MEIRMIRAEEAQPLRSAVLRPGVPFEANIYPLDYDAESLHLGAFEGDELVTVASFFHEPPPGEDNPRAWRLRGMVTLLERQRKGYGRAVLLKGIAHVARQDGTLLWCNARTDAVDFYRTLNFETEGGEQKTERGTGFIRMKRTVTPADTQAGE
ncbi:MAG: GNAT family N-acetyltransferase [Pyrinomonadaceae bacterium]|nr:GNAT family N-acetyltransferase [Pyrinomonadaceae bacterium]